MSELRKQMKIYMDLKGYSSITTKYYINHVGNFAKYYKKSPNLLGEKKYVSICTIVSQKDV